MAEDFKGRLEALFNCEVEILDRRIEGNPAEAEVIVTFPDYPLLPGTAFVTKSEVEGIHEILYIISRKIIRGRERIKALYPDGQQDIYPPALRKKIFEEEVWLLEFDKSQLHRIIASC